VGKVGGKGDRKGSKVVIRDLEREDERNAWHVSGTVEVKLGKEGKERVGKKLNKGICREIEVAQNDEW
jgi:hypothetical protein